MRTTLEENVRDIYQYTFERYCSSSANSSLWGACSWASNTAQSTISMMSNSCKNLHFQIQKAGRMWCEVDDHDVLFAKQHLKSCRRKNPITQNWNYRNSRVFLQNLRLLNSRLRGTQMPWFRVARGIVKSPFFFLYSFFFSSRESNFILKILLSNLIESWMK